MRFVGTFKVLSERTVTARGRGLHTERLQVLDQ